MIQPADLIAFGIMFMLIFLMFFFGYQNYYAKKLKRRYEEEQKAKENGTTRESDTERERTDGSSEQFDARKWIAERSKEFRR